MNNKVIFAAAGHGKTYSICSEAKSIVNSNYKHVLLVSYTNEGVRSLKNEYCKQNCGVLDAKVEIKSWYSFLLSEFIKPYQCLLKLNEKQSDGETPFTFSENYVLSLAFYENDKVNPMGHKYNKYNSGQVQYYLNGHRDVISNEASHLAFLCNEHSDGKVIARMEEIYSHIFIDELQDYAGWDLDLIALLFISKMQITCVGDYKQITYLTNNSSKNKQYRGKKIVDYLNKYQKKTSYTVLYENSTRRFNQEICDFINTIYSDANSNVVPNSDIVHEETPENTGVYMIDEKFLSEYCDYYHPVILQIMKGTAIGFKHNCEVLNYGAVKGATYERVLVIPTKDVCKFIENQTPIKKPQTRAKFYVACTRARFSVVFAMKEPKENDVFKATKLHFSDKVIPAFKFEKTT